MPFVNLAENALFNISFVENLSDLSIAQRKDIYRHIIEAREALKMANELVNQARVENALAAAEAAKKAAAEKAADAKTALCERVNNALIKLNALAEQSDFISLHMSGAQQDANELPAMESNEYKFSLFLAIQDLKILDIIFRHGAGYVATEINEWNENSIQSFVKNFEKIFG